ncbi:phage repressor protein C with HTH and peptisase S24 domain [Tepidamorphus gemmatus]|jgi:phage repressor protein C with HTH and peptisase S24 domain|uniref:Phage repressor protein C with HTH and peptisase S24 domain n=1 Tax=Tepidamorphus gemmatus TaxID=747076 RepID=A0A4R3MIS9_9HYPH|nr:helix-turn-helix transcriptional regulator [Tepidamorphus gemmatus]TCT13223.1 phage repressor protein C with HTH and peptisase S24 domain [Tepidamorphus gemmatus]
MLSHRQIWAAIDALAARHSLSVSGLARRAGLDPTTFNRSKRTGSDGRLRWPNTESIAKILEATGSTMDEFIALMREPGIDETPYRSRSVPLIGLAQAGGGGFFDDGGYPVGSGWDEVTFPDVGDEHAYALEVTGDSMLPLYRDGDRVIVSPGASIRRGDRVVVKTRDGEVMAKVLARRTARTVELHSLNPEHENRVLGVEQIEWMARIIWASQ